MKKIVVAGAGHGGVVAALHLAKQGNSVTVIEKNKREDMGWDWQDVMRRKTWEYIDVPMPDMSNFDTFRPMGYLNPSKNTLVVAADVDPETLFVERKFLIKYLIEQAEAAGVKFVFETEIISVIADTRTVKGIWVKTAEGEKKIYADLVVDAAGMESPVRRSLPIGCGIDNEISAADTFYVYRAYYDKTNDRKLDPEYCVFFFHCGKPGMDWLITEEDYCDILVGSIGPMPENAVEDALKDFRETYDFVGDKLLRGGLYAKIPLRRTLPMIVANGYAAVGDSACMTEPMSGSGITLSMYAGKILADVVAEAGDAALTVDRLWPYQYRYAREFGDSKVGDDFIIHALLGFTTEDVNYALDTKLLGEKELNACAITSYSFQEVLNKASSLVKRPGMMPPLLKAAARLAKAPGVIKKMPEVYDKEKVAEWKAEYAALRED